MLLFLRKVVTLEIPQARVYHSLCTGYAGLAGVVAKLSYGRPLLLTEHGIYTKERRIEIHQAEWIRQESQARAIADPGRGTLRALWIDNFVRLGALTYECADRILTLYGGNRDLEIELGADPRKIEIIPNGVQVDRYEPQRPMQRERLARLRPAVDLRKVALVGRVVPIKDVKMFVRVCRVVLEAMPNVLFQIIGPTDEDREYYQECVELAKVLGVEERCLFTGPRNLIEERTYADLDIMALTSVSEGQPLTVLEAMCVGVPCVTTDVGASGELLNGRTEEDQALGICGFVTPIGNADEFARACLRILRDPVLHSQMVETGWRRVDRYYRQNDTIRRYRELYEAHGGD